MTAPLASTCKFIINLLRLNIPLAHSPKITRLIEYLKNKYFNSLYYTWSFSSLTHNNPSSVRTNNISLLIKCLVNHSKLRRHTMTKSLKDTQKANGSQHGPRQSHDTFALQFFFVRLNIIPDNQRQQQNKTYFIPVNKRVILLTIVYLKHNIRSLTIDELTGFTETVFRRSFG